jgi:hypothetical protein
VLFKELEPQRRRAEFARSRYLNEGTDDALPSLVLLASLVLIVECDHSNDPLACLTYARDRAVRIALTDASSGSGKIRPRHVIAQVLIVASRKFGVADARTIDLISTIAHDLLVLGSVLVDISAELGSPACDHLLRGLGTTFADTCRMAAEWAHMTGIPEHMALAKELKKLSESTGS